MKTNLRLLAAVPVILFFTASVCSPVVQKEKDKVEGKDDTEEVLTSSKAKWSGKLVTEYSGDIRYYDFKSKEETTVFKEARQPSVTPEGDVLTVSARFPKANYLIQLSDPEFNQVKAILDLSDNWIGGHIYGVRMSPDGEHIAVGVTSYGSGYSDYKITKDAVLIFDLGGEIVAKFENKYQPDWTPDGRLVMSGSLLSESSEDKVQTKEDAGIFITKKDFSGVTRIDPGFDDPAPTNVAVSPDGEHVAFIKNSHVWMMDIDGENAKAVTASGGDNAESFPSWSPDGKYIACWSFKTFEKSYYTAIAVVPANTEKAIKLTNDAPVWPRDEEGRRISGGSHQFSWVKNGR